MNQKDSLQQRLLERKKRIAKNKANKSLLVLDTASDNQGRDPRAGAQSVLVGQTPNFTTPEQDISRLLAKFQNLGAAQNLESGDPVVVEEDDDDDMPVGNNTSTLPGSTSTGNLGRVSAGNPKNQNQSVILKSNNPIHPVYGALDNSGFHYNFDAHSKSSAYFMNEDEIQEYEEKMQKKIQEMWASMDQKTEELQKEYQDQLEQIIEEVAQQKFERIAEVKIMYKGRTDEESKAAMEEELAEIRVQTVQLKEAKILEAKEVMEKKKQELK